MTILFEIGNITAPIITQLHCTNLKISQRWWVRGERKREDKHERLCTLFYGFIPNFCCHGGVARFLADPVHWMILNACDLILLLDWEKENSIAINAVILVFVLIVVE